MIGDITMGLGTFFWLLATTGLGAIITTHNCCDNIDIFIGATIGFVIGVVLRILAQVPSGASSGYNSNIFDSFDTFDDF